MPNAAIPKITSDLRASIDPTQHSIFSGASRIPGSEKYPSSPLGKHEQGLPSGRDVEWRPLVDYRRAGVSETTIHGAVAWATPSKIVHSFGGDVLCYGRSMMKPFMIKPLAARLGPVTSPSQKAIMVSSHNGTTQHVEVAQSLLEEDEWGLMQTPLDVPLVQFGRQVRRPRRWYHCCSGEHAGILSACKLEGWSRTGYMMPTHPFFSAYLGELRRHLGASWNPLRVARDGCGLPTVSNTVGELAFLCAALSKHRHEDWIWQSMVDHPDLVGGFGRLDSTIIKSCSGAVIAKEGADGLLGLSIVHKDFPDGLGVVIKIAHGWNSQATWYVARAILGVLGFSLRNPLPLGRQKAFLVSGIVPERFASALENVHTWDDWDPDKDTYDFDWHATT
jgi:L-asparaginase